MKTTPVRRELSALFLLLVVANGGRLGHDDPLLSMERELSERVGVDPSGKFSRQQSHRRPHHVERHDTEELEEDKPVESQFIELEVSEDAHAAVPDGAGDARPEEAPGSVDATPPGPSSGDPSAATPGGAADGPPLAEPNVTNPNQRDPGELDAAGRLPEAVADPPAADATAATNSTPAGEKNSESQSAGEGDNGTAVVGESGDASEGDVVYRTEGDHDGSEQAEPDEPVLPAGGVAEVAAHAVEEVTEAGEVRPEHAEVNLGVIRLFPHMAVWEARLHQAIRDSGSSGKCSDIADTAFRGYGCAIQERDHPACECRGGHEECLKHSSEDVLDYLWMIKDNKTVDETIMRELLAGRCDYMGGHEFNRGTITGVSLALLFPIFAACALCCCPSLFGIYVWDRKRRRAGGKRGAKGDGPLLEAPASSADGNPFPQPAAASEAAFAPAAAGQEAAP